MANDYASLMHRASLQRRLETDPLRAAWWDGYVRGLRRAHHGEEFGSEADHERRVLAADSRNVLRAAMGRGYCAGLTLTADEPDCAAPDAGRARVRARSPSQSERDAGEASRL